MVKANTNDIIGKFKRHFKPIIQGINFANMFPANGHGSNPMKEIVETPSDTGGRLRQANFKDSEEAMLASLLYYKIHKYKMVDEENLINFRIDAGLGVNAFGKTSMIEVANELFAPNLHSDMLGLKRSKPHHEEVYHSSDFRETPEKQAPDK